MSIRIYDNQRIGIDDALKSYITTIDGFQDYAMGAGCAGDIMYTFDDQSQLAKNLIVAGAGVCYISKVPNAVFSIINTPSAIAEAIKDPTFANVGRAFYATTNASSCSIGLVSSALNTVCGKIAGIFSLSCSAMEITLDFTSLMDQFTIERIYSNKNMHAEVTEALAETRIWRGLCLGKSLAKTCAKVCLLAAPFVALPVAIGIVATSTVISIGMSLTENVFKKCIMDHLPVHPTDIQNQGKDLPLIRNKKCIIL